MNIVERRYHPNLILRALASLIFILKMEITPAQNTLPLTEARTMPNAAPTVAGRSIFDEMLAAKSDDITIVTDLDALIEGKSRSEYQSGQIIFGKKQTLQMELRPRGKFRRKICEFPPLKIKFSKKELANAGFSKLNEVKLVTHCADSDAGNQLIAREFLPYMMYAELTPIAHRARLVDVTYIDSKNEKYRIHRLGILLEDDEELAARLGGSVVDSMYNLPADSLNTQLAATTVLFEYMIGNTDWSIEGVRNIKFLRPEAGGKICPVPYDFDFSGFVNASYASPNSEFPIKNVRERYWQGASLPPEVVRRAAKSFHKKESRFHDIITDAAVIDDFQKEELGSFIDGFFKILEQTNDLPANKTQMVNR